MGWVRGLGYITAQSSVARLLLQGDLREEATRGLGDCDQMLSKPHDAQV